MRLAPIVCLMASSCTVNAFTVPSNVRVSSVQRSAGSLVADGDEREREGTPNAPEIPPVPPTLTANGWAPDPAAFCWGLPGACAPMGNFDPLGFATGASLERVKLFREAEVTHGRVAMMATVGMLVSESPFHPLFKFMAKVYHSNRQLTGPSIRHLDEVREVAPFGFEALVAIIALSELHRCTAGWGSPLENGTGNFWMLKKDYYPGDIGFDPLGFKPCQAPNFVGAQTRELQNGRLAMVAAAGFVAQELVNEKAIFENLFG